MSVESDLRPNSCFNSNEKKFCPTCYSSNMQTELKLYQINFTTAVYICQNKSCTYPSGYGWFYVQRNIDTDSESDIDDKETEETINSTIDNEIDSILNSVCKSDTVNDQNIQKMFSDLINIDNTSQCLEYTTQELLDDIILRYDESEINTDSNILIDNDFDELFNDIDNTSKVEDTLKNQEQNNDFNKVDVSKENTSKLDIKIIENKRICSPKKNIRTKDST